MSLLAHATAARSAVHAERCRRDFAYFVRSMWPVIEPGTVLKWSWHLDVLCDHLAATQDGRKLQKLVIAMPPRHLKSTIVSVMFHPWVWLRKPEARFLTASYAIALATRDAVRSRRIIESDAYQALKPPFSASADQNEKKRYENSAMGYRMVTAPGAGTTGEGGTIQIIDDPHNVLDVESEDMRQTVINWFDVAWSNRANEAATAVSIVTAQRTHEDDLTGSILKKSASSWCLLKLPTCYEADCVEPANQLGFRDPRLTEGELLCAAHFPLKAVEEARETMGSWAFEAQHQQRPSSTKGTILSIDDLRRWHSLPLRFDHECLSWDFNFGGSSSTPNEKRERKQVADPSFVVGQYWGFKGQAAYLIDQVRGQWTFTQSLAQFKSLAQRYPHVRTKLIEAKANGPAIQSSVQHEMTGIAMVDPIGSKIQRAYAIQPAFQAGKIHIPDSAPWLDRFLAETKNFPFVKHNDQVDTMTQAVNWWLMKSGHVRIRMMRLLKA